MSIDLNDRAHQLLLSSLYRRAVEAASSLEWSQAVNLFGQILKIDPDYGDVRRRLAHAEVQARLAALYVAALDALQAERWQDAVDALREIVSADADYRDAPELLTQAGMALAEFKAREHLARLYRDGAAHYEDKRWQEAQACLGQVIEADPDYQDAATLWAQARRRARWSRSILGRASRTLAGWPRGPSETSSSTTEHEPEPRKEHERDHPTQA
jgi:tetratricopeptide (TPR) repeat protein